MSVSSFVDLRSDFLTQPTSAMQAAMTAAAHEPACFGLREDRYQQRLEQRVATLLGTEDALLFPTCTMANEVALMLLTAPGDIVLAPPAAHVLTSEAGGPAALAGVQIVAVADNGACPPPAAWEALACAIPDALKPRISALVLENTHNREGGLPVSADSTRAVIEVARRHGLRAHLDGSRVFNAGVALGVETRSLCIGFDTIAVSLNKGLGAPIGAALAGSTEYMKRALVLRQRLGGGIRPTGIIAAAALEALNSIADLANDHARARTLVTGLATMRSIEVNVAAVQTNIVIVDVRPSGLSAAEMCTRLAEHGLLALPFGRQRVRLVVYRGIGDDDITRAVAAFRAVCS